MTAPRRTRSGALEVFDRDDADRSMIVTVDMDKSIIVHAVDRATDQRVNLRLSQEVVADIIEEIVNQS